MTICEAEKKNPPTERKGKNLGVSNIKSQAFVCTKIFIKLAMLYPFFI